MADLNSRIEAHALANAIKYNGTASVGSVLPKIIGEFPDEKKDVRALKEKIEHAVAKVNALPPAQQRAMLEQLAPELLEKKVHKEKDLPELPNAVDGKVVTRIPPEPSKYNHLGHALTFLLNSIYADRYHGKVIIRFEDANPEKVNQEYVDTMLDDITNYLDIHPAQIRFVSDDMDVLLDYAAKLIERGGAYMCFCERETMSKNREQGIECACRDKPLAEQLSAWKEFQHGKYLRGEAILRFKGEMTSQNTVLRDPVLWRAVATPHFKQGSKYKIWPTYDFYSPIEEALCGVTHVLRSNEFDLRVELQERIKKLLDLPDQSVLQYGRFNVTGTTTQGREIREAIASGQYTGWDDPRLVTLKALKRRGIVKEAYYDLVKSLGLSPHPVNLDFTMLAASNRKFIEHGDRFSFVADPQEIVVAGAVPKDVELDLHPERKGGRPIKTGNRFYISRDDKLASAGKKVRLMGLCTIEEKDDSYALVTYEQVKKGHDIIVNWLPADSAQTVSVEVMMPDATVKKGLGEKNITRLRVGDIVQLERFGFCRLDAVENGTYKFWYAHK